MGELDPALVEKAAEALTDRMDLGTSGRYIVIYDVTPEDLAEAVLDAVVPAVREAAQREHRIEWADYIANWDGAVGPEPPTVWSIVEALRAERLPFGSAQQQQREEASDGR